MNRLLLLIVAWTFFAAQPVQCDLADNPAYWGEEPSKYLVAPGPMAKERQELYGQILKAGDKGVGIPAYLSNLKLQKSHPILVSNQTMSLLE